MFSVKTATVDDAEMLGDILGRSARFAYAGITHARLTFVRGNARAEAFYLRNGWVSSGELIAFNDHGRELIDVVMRRTVE
jgi:hypothetical protein